MKNKTLFSVLTCMVIGGAFVLASASVPAEAAAPKCKGSTGGGHRLTCTDDYKAKEKPTARRVAIKKRFKVKQIPCYQSDVPGCRE